LAAQSKSNAAAIADNKGQVAGLRSSVDSLSVKADKAENANNVWKANFQVVNATFAELRKKLKMSVPIIKLPVYAGR